MELDQQACYRAVRARDARFDGRFFTAVRSTGIYCRPICPARTPRPENCTFVPSAAAAQEMGYRPCLRCRPEAAPGTPTWLGTSAAVSRALRLIANGALDEGSVDDLAERLGVGGRHLRRLFLKHVGASPLAVAKTRRILFAKKLIDETDLPMTQLALASGFGSLRRFNDAMKQVYGCSPRELRRGREEQPGSDIDLRLTYRSPLAWDVVSDYLAARSTAGVESVVDGAYRRTIRAGERTGWVEVRCVPGKSHLSARLVLGGSESLVPVVERLRSMFDLDADPEEIARHLSGDPLLAPVVAEIPGLRVPGAWDGFELTVRAILGQQISVKAATTMAGRLAEQFGEPVDERGGFPEELRTFFPRPEDVVDAELERIGLIAARAGAIRGLARAVVDGRVRFDGSRSPEEVVTALKELPGIGDWTAQYVAMRALRDPDAFPAGDLGLRKAACPGEGLVTERQLREASESWRPWRAYAAMAFWMSESLEVSA